MNKVISFSLWGDNPKYTVGAIRNAQLALEIYPQWDSWFYIGDNVPNYIVAELVKIPKTKIILKSGDCDWTSMYWRFEAGYSADITIFRDTDSRLNYREKSAVDEWLNSDKTIHIMRDHPYHGYPILGGMWGFKNNGKYNLQEILESFHKTNEYGTDYVFLAKKIYDITRNDQLVHDEFFEHKAFPKPRDGTEFVGDVFDENDNRHPEYYRYINER